MDEKSSKNRNRSSELETVVEGMITLAEKLTSPVPNFWVRLVNAVGTQIRGIINALKRK